LAFFLAGFFFFAFAFFFATNQSPPFLLRPWDVVYNLYLTFLISARKVFVFCIFSGNEGREDRSAEGRARDLSIERKVLSGWFSIGAAPFSVHQFVNGVGHHLNHRTLFLLDEPIAVPMANEVRFPLNCRKELAVNDNRRRVRVI
jgi:hypothetical protein